MTADIENTIKSLLTDIESMRCDCPSYDINEVGGEEDTEHWFGGFSDGHYDDENYNTYVQWPNLSILADNLRKLLVGHDKVKIGRPLDQ